MGILNEDLPVFAPQRDHLRRIDLLDDAIASIDKRPGVAGVMQDLQDPAWLESREEQTALARLATGAARKLEASAIIGSSATSRGRFLRFRSWPTFTTRPRSTALRAVSAQAAANVPV